MNLNNVDYISTRCYHCDISLYFVKSCYQLLLFSSLCTKICNHTMRKLHTPTVVGSFWINWWTIGPGWPEVQLSPLTNEPPSSTVWEMNIKGRRCWAQRAPAPPCLMFYGQCVSIIPSSARLSVLNRKLEVEQQQHLSQFMIVLQKLFPKLHIQRGKLLHACCIMHAL